jgi:D-sedoheptulose 7-phosphate isomerase/D-glycero-D-manno-heptose 1,7-bisphosphate phosphatase
MTCARSHSPALTEAAVAEVTIHVDGTNYGIVEDLHQAIMHGLAQYIRQSRMTADAISSGVF